MLDWSIVGCEALGPPPVQNTSKGGKIRSQSADQLKPYHGDPPRDNWLSKSVATNTELAHGTTPATVPETITPILTSRNSCTDTERLVAPIVEPDNDIPVNQYSDISENSGSLSSRGSENEPLGLCSLLEETDDEATSASEVYVKHNVLKRFKKKKHSLRGDRHRRVSPKPVIQSDSDCDSAPPLLKSHRERKVRPNQKNFGKHFVNTANVWD